MVILSHCHPYFAGISHHGLPPLIDSIVTNGDKGVTLFYLISAFTLCLSFSKKQALERQPLKNYFVSRFFRIVPLYYFTILIILAIPGKSPSIHSILSNIFFLHGLNPYWINSTVAGGWSVGIEMLFYIIFPFFFFKIKSLNKAIIMALTFIIIAKFITSFMFKHPLIDDSTLWGIFIYENLISQLPVFLIGICVFYASNTKENQLKSNTYLIIAVLAITQLLGGNLFKPHYLFSIAFAFAIYSLAKFQGDINTNKRIEWFGKYSYSLYLNHIIVLKLLSKYHFLHFTSNTVIDLFFRFTICVCLSAIISLVTYNLIELPFQTLGKMIIKKHEAKYALEKSDFITV